MRCQHVSTWDSSCWSGVSPAVDWSKWNNGNLVFCVLVNCNQQETDDLFLDIMLHVV